MPLSETQIRLALPLAVTPTGRLQTVEKGTSADILQRAVLVCATRPRTIPDQDGYGLYEQAGRAGGADVDEIRLQLERWLPDAAAFVEDDPAALNDALALVNVKVAGR